MENRQNMTQNDNLKLKNFRFGRKMSEYVRSGHRCDTQVGSKNNIFGYIPI